MYRKFGEISIKNKPMTISILIQKLILNLPVFRYSGESNTAFFYCAEPYVCGPMSLAVYIIVTRKNITVLKKFPQSNLFTDSSPFSHKNISLNPEIPKCSLSSLLMQQNHLSAQSSMMNWECQNGPNPKKNIVFIQCRMISLFIEKKLLQCAFNCWHTSIDNSITTKNNMGLCILFCTVL